MYHLIGWKSARIAALLVIGGALGLPAAQSDISGFGGGANWSTNCNPNGPCTTPYFSSCPDMLTLTDDMAMEGASVFFLDQQNVGAFSSQFTYQVTGGGVPSPADGVAFVIQGDSRGPDALGGAGGCLGWCGISPSIAVAFNIYNQRLDGIRGTNVFIDGQLTLNCYFNPIYLDSTPVNLVSGDPIQVNLTYDGTTLMEVLLDTVTGDQSTFTYTIDIAGDLGSSRGYVGFTGATGGGRSFQTIAGFSYTYTGP